MLGRRLAGLSVAVMASLSALGSAAGPLVLSSRAPLPTTAPSSTVNILGFGYRRKDRHKNAAQVKRASVKAANRKRHNARA